MLPIGEATEDEDSVIDCIKLDGRVEVRVSDKVLDPTESEGVGVPAGGVKAEEVATLPSLVLYQCASGSPKHSPIVTPLYPFDTRRSSIYPVRLCAVCSLTSWAIVRKLSLAGLLGLIDLAKLFFEFWIRSGDAFSLSASC
jgi:hypothetical protein